MFARILDFEVKMEKKDEFIKVVKNEVLPILKKQNGFLDILPLFPETLRDKVYTISLWGTKTEADRYEREVYPRIHGILNPYLTTPVMVKTFTVETSLCEHFVEALAA